MSDDLSATLGRNIPLFEMLQTLRAELGASMNVAKDERVRFHVEEVELELRVCVSKEGGRNGQVKFWVLEGGAKASHSQQDTHVFKLKLKPITADGKRLEVTQATAERATQ